MTLQIQHGIHVAKPTILQLSQTWCGHNTPLKWMAVHVAQEVGTHKALDAMGTLHSYARSQHPSIWEWEHHILKWEHSFTYMDV